MGPLIFAAWMGLAPAWGQQTETVVQQSGDSLAMGGASSGVPEIYVVQPGDTLWDISSKFLGNATYWPRLWSINEQITNPHWIYPGNKVRFTLGTLLEPPDVSLEGASQDGYQVEPLAFEDANITCGPDIRFNVGYASEQLEAPGFMAAKDDVDVLGHVHRARGMQTYLSETDLVYLDLDNPDAYECGDVVMIFRPVKSNVRHPTQRKTHFGNVYRIVGEARVVHEYGKYVSAVVRTSWSEIQRGDLVGSPIPINIETETEVPDGDLEGTVVARLTTEATLAGTGETVFLDRGRADGLRVGNAFYVVEQRDEHVNLRGEDTELPPSVIGRIVVVRVDDYSSTGVVVDAARPINVGNRVAMTVE